MREIIFVSHHISRHGTKPKLDICLPDGLTIHWSKKFPKIVSFLFPGLLCRSFATVFVATIVVTIFTVTATTLGGTTFQIASTKLSPNHCSSIKQSNDTPSHKSKVSL